MGVKKNLRTGLWYFRTRVTNPFTGQEERLKRTPPKAINSKKTAEEWEKNFIRKATANPADASSVTEPKPGSPLREAAARFIEHLRNNPELSESYVMKVAGNFRYHILPKFGDRAVDMVTDDELDMFKVFLLNKTCTVNGKVAKKLREEKGPLTDDELAQPNGKKLAARSVKDILRCFHGFFVYAKTKALVKAVPRFPKPPKPIKTKPVFLTFDETTQVLTALDDPDDRLLIHFAVGTGVRAGEQIAFKWEDIEWSVGEDGSGRITIRRAHKRSETIKNKVGAPKSKAERSIDIDADLVSALEEAKRRRFGDKRAMGLVFTRNGGERMNHDALTGVLVRALRGAGIEKHVRWHDLRHTFGSHMAMRGTSLRLIQDWMGHSSVTVTEIYSHLCPLEGREAMKKAHQARPLVLPPPATPKTN